jgi:hypothetical protein
MITARATFTSNPPYSTLPYSALMAVGVGWLSWRGWFGVLVARYGRAVASSQ